MGENNALRPGEARVIITFRPAMLANQPNAIDVQIEGVDSPFDGIRLVRAAEDQIRNDAERAIQQIMQGQNRPVAVAKIH